MSIRKYLINGLTLLIISITIFTCTYHTDYINDRDRCHNGKLDNSEECIDCGGPCSPCAYVRGRYIEPLFSKFQVIRRIKYKTGILKPSGIVRDLTCDFYEVKADTLNNRPLIIMMGQTNYTDDPDETVFTDGINYLTDFLAKGYTVVNIRNIRFWNGKFPMNTHEFISTAIDIRADFLSAIKFFKKYAEYFRIDTGNIWLMGSSMGAMAALHAAYLGQNDMDELDPYTRYCVEQNSVIDGEQDYNNIPPNVKGVISLSGMILDADFIDRGEPSLLNIIGKNDEYRPSGCEKVKVDWIADSLEFCGPEAMEERMLAERYLSGDRVLKLIIKPPANLYAPHDPSQCPECPNVITGFIASHLGYCLYIE